MEATKKIAILMATYNGESFLSQQLDSIINQTYPNWCLYVLDDGSSDKTWEILNTYQKKWGAEKMQIFQQKNHGVFYTFMSLVCNPAIKADYYAYADQDDIWDKDKLEKAIEMLMALPHDNLQLYCSGARLINESNQIIGALPIKKRKLTFQHALIQNISTGNTMVFNLLAKNIIAQAGSVVLDTVHDWWTYIAITACGGIVLYDPRPSISYRIHRKNTIGFVGNAIGRNLKRLKRVFNNDLISANNANIQCLLRVEPNMTAESKKRFHYFVQSRKGNVFKRLYYLYKSGVYREEIAGTLGVYFSQIMGKF